MKKVNKILIAIALMIVTFLVSNSVLAATISRTFTTYNNGNGRKSGFYAVLAGTDSLAPLIKIVETANTNNNSVYCFKGGTGFSGGNTATATTYTQSMSLLQSRSSFVSQYPGYESAIPSTVANYNSAVALLSVSCWRSVVVFLSEDCFSIVIVCLALHGVFGISSKVNGHIIASSFFTVYY